MLHFGIKFVGDLHKGGGFTC